MILFTLRGDHFKALDLKNDPSYLVRNLHFTNKGEKDHFKALDLKNGFLGDDKSLIYELILALVLLCLLFNLINKEKSQRKTSD